MAGREFSQGTRGRPDTALVATWVDALGNATLPVLAGFSTTTVIVVSDDVDHFRWPGVTITVLATATVLLIGAVQCAYHARMYLAGEPAGNESFTPWESGRRKLGLAWSRRTRRAYHWGIIALLAGMALAVAPYRVKGMQANIQWWALGLAFGACGFEALWIARQAWRSHARAVKSTYRVRDGSGRGYRVTLTDIVDPGKRAAPDVNPDDGTRVVGAVFEIRARRGRPEDEDANNNAALIGSNDQTYTTSTAEIAGYSRFKDGKIQVTQDGAAEGVVTFLLPGEVEVAEVQWSAAAGRRSAVRWKAGRRAAGGDGSDEEPPVLADHARQSG